MRPSPTGRRVRRPHARIGSAGGSQSDVPIAYPRALFDQKVEGDVTLRLFVDSTGTDSESTRRRRAKRLFRRSDSRRLAVATGLRCRPRQADGVPRRNGVPAGRSSFRQVRYHAPPGAVPWPPPPRPTPVAPRRRRRSAEASPARVSPGAPNTTARILRKPGRHTTRPPPDTTRLVRIRCLSTLSRNANVFETDRLDPPDPHQQGHAWDPGRRCTPKRSFQSRRLGERPYRVGHDRGGQNAKGSSSRVA